MKCKLIVADIDDTLTSKDKNITNRNIETIKKLRTKGIIFGYASGRPVSDQLKRFNKFGIINDFDFIIGYNGSQLYDNKTKILYKYNYLSPLDLKEIIEFMANYDNTICMYHKDDSYYSSKESNRAWYSAFRNDRKFIVIQNKEEFYKEASPGIMFRCHENDVKQIEKDLEIFTKDRNYCGFKTQADLIEFSIKGNNKASGLKKYLELYDISLDDCIAFGDTTNDNEMLRCCYGVCMKNGSDDTKACAKAITDKDSNDDGFSDFIEKYILI